MKVLFHNKTLNYRGVTNSTIDYAYYNQIVLGNESVIAYDANFDSSGGLDIDSKSEVIDRIKGMFKLVTYENLNHLNRIAEKYDVVYTQKAGFADKELITSTRHAVHAVFQYYQPHGTFYAYISEWLAKEIERTVAKNALQKFVPYIVNLPPMLPTLRDRMREALGIPKDAFVIGRHGGLMTFDIPFVNTQLYDLCEKHKNLYFLLANTNQRATHNRIIYMKPFFGVHAKTSFAAACDAGLHGRTLGESFGLGICEMLFHNKPVLAWEGGFDKNHVDLLKGHDLLYSEDNFMDKVGELIVRPPEDYAKIVSPYTPEKVMLKFKSVFLDN